MNGANHLAEHFRIAVDDFNSLAPCGGEPLVPNAPIVLRLFQLTRTIDKQVPTAAHYLFPATSSTLLQITRYLSLPSLFPVLVLRVFFKCFFKQTPGSHAIKKSQTASVTIVTGIKTFSPLSTG